MSANSVFDATCVTGPARRLLASGAALHVLGTPGRGILLDAGVDGLVFLHPGDRPASPSAICVSRAGEWEVWVSGLAPGARVECSRQGLTFPEHGGFVDLTRAAAWDPRVSALDPDASARLPVLERALATRRDDGLVAAMSPTEAMSDLTPLARRTRRTISRLDAAVEAARPAGLVEAAVDLLGLGPGLTPSGDDFLVGFLGTLRLSDPRGAALVDAAAAPLLALAAERTTLVALSFLRHALRGEFAAPVQAVLEGLRGSTPTPRLEAAVSALLGWGHTSGADTLAGIVSGLRVAGAAPDKNRFTTEHAESAEGLNHRTSERPNVRTHLLHVCVLRDLRGESLPGSTP